MNNLKMNRAQKKDNVKDTSKSKDKGSKNITNSPLESNKTLFKKPVEENVMLRKKIAEKEELIAQRNRFFRMSPRQESDSEENNGEEKFSSNNLKSPSSRIKVEEGVKIIFVGNLPLKITEGDLKKFFDKCGKIHEIRIAKTPQGFSKGYSHVEFELTSSVRNAVKLNGKELNGRPLKVDVSNPSKRYIEGHYKAKNKN